MAAGASGAENGDYSGPTTCGKQAGRSRESAVGGKQATLRARTTRCPLSPGCGLRVARVFCQDWPRRLEGLFDSPSWAHANTRFRMAPGASGAEGLWRVGSGLRCTTAAES
jgi:hypothetical protein